MLFMEFPSSWRQFSSCHPARPFIQNVGLKIQIIKFWKIFVFLVASWINETKCSSFFSNKYIKNNKVKQINSDKLCYINGLVDRISIHISALNKQLYESDSKYKYVEHLTEYIDVKLNLLLSLELNKLNSLWLQLNYQLNLNYSSFLNPFRWNEEFGYE